MGFGLTPALALGAPVVTETLPPALRGAGTLGFGTSNVGNSPGRVGSTPAGLLVGDWDGEPGCGLGPDLRGGPAVPGAGAGMSRLSTLDVYERWAPGYRAEPHNPLMSAEQRVMLAQLPILAGRDVLDLGCGTGRYSEIAAQAGARRVVAMDFSPAMLAQVQGAARIRADMSALPLRDECVDVVLSGLAIGHVTDLARCMRDIARMLRPGGRPT